MLRQASMSFFVAGRGGLDNGIVPARFFRQSRLLPQRFVRIIPLTDAAADAAGVIFDNSGFAFFPITITDVFVTCAILSPFEKVKHIIDVTVHDKPLIHPTKFHHQDGR